jgi:hypothetical protein
MMMEVLVGEALTFTLTNNLLHHLKNDRTYLKPVFKLPNSIREKYVSRYEMNASRNTNEIELLKAYECNEGFVLPNINFEIVANTTEKERAVPGLWAEVKVICTAGDNTEEMAFNINFATSDFRDIVSDFQQRLMGFTKLINEAVYNNK